MRTSAARERRPDTLELVWRSFGLLARRGRGAVIGLAAVVLGATALPGGCSRESIEGLGCGCAPGYLCCEPVQTCLADTDPCRGKEDWSTLPVISGPSPQAMDDLTVFAVAQLPLAGASDTKALDRILQVSPDLVLRGWGQWSDQGILPSSYDGRFISSLHQHQPPILFLGGGTASALFAAQFPAQEGDFQKYASRSASHGLPVLHADLNEGEARGSLANPHFRDYLANIAGYQMERGVDGLVFSELNADMLGNHHADDDGYDGDEGYDDYHITDFTDFLLAKYTDDALKVFDLPRDNQPSRKYSALRLTPRDGWHNFNYRDYRGMGGTRLAADWGAVVADTTPSQPMTFADQATPYHYWPALVKELRDRATVQGLGRFFISANGIFPGVDFVSYSLYDDDAHPWQKNTRFPFPDGHLDGGRSHLADFAAIRDQAALVVPGAPVILYLDGRWRSYHSTFSTAERRDFWRIYAAEAYASGIFFAFLINPPDVSDGALPTAAEDGTLDLFAELATFYRAHAELYHHVAPDPTSLVTLSVPDVAVSVMRQAGREGGPGRRVVHFINHDYVQAPSSAAGLQVHEQVKVALPAMRPPSHLRFSTPDVLSQPAAVDVELSAEFDGTSLTVTLPRLEAYDVVTISD